MGEELSYIAFASTAGLVPKHKFFFLSLSVFRIHSRWAMFIILEYLDGQPVEPQWLLECLQWAFIVTQPQLVCIDAMIAVLKRRMVIDVETPAWPSRCHIHGRQQSSSSAVPIFTTSTVLLCEGSRNMFETLDVVE